MKWGAGNIEDFNRYDTIIRQTFNLASLPLPTLTKPKPLPLTGPSQSDTDIAENFMFWDFCLIPDMKTIFKYPNDSVEEAAD